MNTTLDLQTRPAIRLESDLPAELDLSVENSLPVETASVAFVAHPNANPSQSRLFRLQSLALQSLLLGYPATTAQREQLLLKLQEALLKVKSGEVHSINEALTSSAQDASLQAFLSSSLGRQAVQFLQSSESSQSSRESARLLLGIARTLVPPPQTLRRLAGLGILFSEVLQGEDSKTNLFHRELLSLGRDFMNAFQHSAADWMQSLLHWNESLFSQSDAQLREVERRQSLESLLQVANVFSAETVSQSKEGELGTQLGWLEVEASLRRSSILFASSMEERLSVLANYAASVSSGYAQVLLSRTPLSTSALFLSALVGGVNGFMQSSIQLSQQMGRLNPEQARAQRATLLWQLFKGTATGSLSGLAENAVSRIFHSLPVSHPLLKMFIGAFTFCLGDIGGELGATHLLTQVGILLGLERLQLSDAEGVFSFVCNAIEEIGGGMTHGLSPVNLMNVGALGAADVFHLRPSEILQLPPSQPPEVAKAASSHFTSSLSSGSRVSDFHNPFELNPDSKFFQRLEAPPNLCFMFDSSLEDLGLPVASEALSSLQKSQREIAQWRIEIATSRLELTAKRSIEIARGLLLILEAEQSCLYEVFTALEELGAVCPKEAFKTYFSVLMKIFEMKIKVDLDDFFKFKKNEGEWEVSQFFANPDSLENSPFKKKLKESKDSHSAFYHQYHLLSPLLDLDYLSLHEAPEQYENLNKLLVLNCFFKLQEARSQLLNEMSWEDYYLMSHILINSQGKIPQVEALIEKNTIRLLNAFQRNWQEYLENNEEQNLLDYEKNIQLETLVKILLLAEFTPLEYRQVWILNFIPLIQNKKFNIRENLEMLYLVVFESQSLFSEEDLSQLLEAFVRNPALSHEKWKQIKAWIEKNKSNKSNFFSSLRAQAQGFEVLSSSNLQTMALESSVLLGTDKAQNDNEEINLALNVRKKVAIIGGGIAGLFSALHLVNQAKDALEVTVLDAQIHEWGGKAAPRNEGAQFLDDVEGNPLIEFARRQNIPLIDSGDYDLAPFLLSDGRSLSAKNFHSALTQLRQAAVKSLEGEDFNKLDFVTAYEWINALADLNEDEKEAMRGRLRIEEGTSDISALSLCINLAKQKDLKRRFEVRGGISSLVEGLKNYLQERGVHFVLDAPIRQILHQDNQVIISGKHQAKRIFDAAILAVAPEHLKPDHLHRAAIKIEGSDAPWQRLAHLKSATIHKANLEQGDKQYSQDTLLSALPNKASAHWAFWTNQPSTVFNNPHSTVFHGLAGDAKLSAFDLQKLVYTRTRQGAKVSNRAWDGSVSPEGVRHAYTTIAHPGHGLRIVKLALRLALGYYNEGRIFFANHVLGLGVYTHDAARSGMNMAEQCLMALGIKEEVNLPFEAPRLLGVTPSRYEQLVAQMLLEDVAERTSLASRLKQISANTLLDEWLAEGRKFYAIDLRSTEEVAAEGSVSFSHNHFFHLPLDAQKSSAPQNSSVLWLKRFEALHLNPDIPVVFLTSSIQNRNHEITELIAEYESKHPKRYEANYLTLENGASALLENFKKILNTTHLHKKVFLKPGSNFFTSRGWNREALQPVFNMLGRLFYGEKVEVEDLEYLENLLSDSE